MLKDYLRRNARALSVLLRLLDIALVVATGVLSLTAVFGAAGEAVPPRASYAIALTAAIAAAAFAGAGIYRTWRGTSLTKELARIVLAWTGVFLVLGSIAVVTDARSLFARDWLLNWFALGFLALVTQRLMLRSALRVLRRAGYNQRHILLVGSGELSARVHRQLEASPSAGLNVLGYFDDRKTRRANDHPGTRLGHFGDIADYVHTHGVQQVWLVLPLRAEAVMKRIQHELRHTVVVIRLVPDIFGFELLSQSIGEVAGLPVVNLSSTPMLGANRWKKRAEDICLTLVILTLAAPLMLLIATIIKITSPGPVIYRQVRIGGDGKPFTLLKFRSMPVDVENGTGPSWSRTVDDRPTPFGGFLRRMSLDELPQFFNVLRGDMSIVGPRPERPMFVEQFKDQIPGYMKKHLVNAGITGWAQINGWRGDTDLGKRIEHDLHYINNWSLFFDLKIMALTLFKGFVNKNV